MEQHTLQNKDRWRIMGIRAAGQTQTVIARKIGINQSQVSQLIAKYRQTNDVTDRPQPGDHDSLLLPMIEYLWDLLL